MLAKRLEIGASGNATEVRFFSDANLQSSINNALAGVTERSAVLQLEKNPTGFNAAIAAKIDGHWSIAAAYQKSSWGDSIGTKVKFSW
jgi:outer membrane receptor for monomeric catechols